MQIDQVPTDIPAGTTVLDVREPHEWAAGHIEGAVHVPLGQLQERVAEVPTDGQVLCVCHGGGRSARATAFLQTNGVQAVNLDGGMVAWSRAGRRMVSENGATPTVD